MGRGIQGRVAGGYPLFLTLLFILSSTKVESKNTSVLRVTDQEAVIVATTQETSSCWIEYGLTENLGSLSLETIPSTQHSILIKKLKPSTLYYFRVKSQALSGRARVSQMQNFKTMADVSAPSLIITAPSREATVAGTALITTLVEDNGDVAKVQFKLDGKNLGEKTSAPFSISWNTAQGADGVHTLTAVATDANGNQGNSLETSVTVDNTPPKPSVPEVLNKTSRSAIISWQTNEPSTSQALYRAKNQQKAWNASGQETELVAAHKIILSKLLANTLYEFQIISADATGNIMTQEAFKFRTLPTTDPNPPEILEISASNITDREAQISWITNEPATSKVLYKTQAVPEVSFIPEDQNLDTNHYITLTDLKPATLYEYEVESEDASGNKANSVLFSFRTLSPFLRGDVNADGAVDILDAGAINSYLLTKGTLSCLKAADINDDGKIDRGDSLDLQSYLFDGAAAPKAPFPGPGIDSTPDSLTCNGYSPSAKPSGDETTIAIAR